MSCRCVVVNGYAVKDYTDLLHHFRSIVEDSWLHGQPFVLSRSERRSLRSCAPDLPRSTFIYFFDGAPRNADHTKRASFGALLRFNGITLSRYAVYLGDATNNEAEYGGILAVLRHALLTQHTRICIYGDSKLVISQLNGI